MMSEPCPLCGWFKADATLDDLEEHVTLVHRMGAEATQLINRERKRRGMIEHPDEPHMHCPVCLAVILGAEAAPESGVNATAHFKAEHPALYEQISDRAKEYVMRAKSKLN